MQMFLLCWAKKKKTVVHQTGLAYSRANQTGKMFCSFSKENVMCSREYHLLQGTRFGFVPTTPPPLPLILIALDIPVWIYTCRFFQRNFCLLDPTPLEFPIIILKSRPNDRNITQHCCATCCAHFALCCDMLDVVFSSLEMVIFFIQHLWILHAVVLAWPGSCNNIAPGLAR